MQLQHLVGDLHLPLCTEMNELRTRIRSSVSLWLDSYCSLGDHVKRLVVLCTCRICFLTCCKIFWSLVCFDVMMICYQRYDRDEMADLRLKCPNRFSAYDKWYCTQLRIQPLSIGRF